MTDRIREAVLRNESGNRLKEIAISEGMSTMRESGIRKALEGESTVEEVCRLLLTEEMAEVTLDEELPKAA
jgi:Type II secretory pathway, ATPase PulE/Tfp pilus assembly pathway, ATPase PilB